MAIGVIEINGAIPRVSDYAQFKHNEDNKVNVQQGTLTAEARKDEQARANEVTRGDDASNYLKRFDAKEKGSNEYTKGEERKKDKKKQGDGNVVVRGSTSSFDIRI